MIIVTSIFMITLIMAAASFSEMKIERDANKSAESVGVQTLKFAKK